MTCQEFVVQDVMHLDVSRVSTTAPVIHSSISFDCLQRDPNDLAFLLVGIVLQCRACGSHTRSAAVLERHAVTLQKSDTEQ